MRLRRLVFTLILLILSPFIVSADGASLYVSPESAQHSIGDSFDVRVFVDSAGVSVNAAEGDIAFNPAAVEVEGLSIDDSLLDIWPSPPVFSNKDGYVRFSGLMSAPYTGREGKLITITFKALRNMSTNARFAAGAILAADGQSSNIITSMNSGVFTIQPKEISPSIIPENPVEAQEQIAPIKPTAPVFTEVESPINAGNHFLLRGSANANTKIAVYVTHGQENAVRSDILSDSTGAFTFLSDAAKPGVYSIYVTAISPDGITSDSSRTVTVTVISLGVAAAAVFGVSIAYQLMPLALVLVLAGLGGGYILHRHKIAKLHHDRGGHIF